MIAINDKQISSVEMTKYIPSESCVWAKPWIIFGLCVRRGRFEFARTGDKCPPAFYPRLYVKPDGAVFERSRMVITMANGDRFERCFYDDAAMGKFYANNIEIHATAMIELDGFTKVGFW